jgi:hypothetical protein
MTGWLFSRLADRLAKAMAFSFKLGQAHRWPSLPLSGEAEMGNALVDVIAFPSDESDLFGAINEFGHCALCELEPPRKLGHARSLLSGAPLIISISRYRRGVRLERCATTSDRRRKCRSAERNSATAITLPRSTPRVIARSCGGIRACRREY